LLGLIPPAARLMIDCATWASSQPPTCRGRTIPPVATGVSDLSNSRLSIGRAVIRIRP
jgi:hypothetical protein